MCPLSASCKCPHTGLQPTSTPSTSPRASPSLTSLQQGSLYTTAHTIPSTKPKPRSPKNLQSGKALLHTTVKNASQGFSPMHSSASGLFFFPRPQIEPQSPPAPQPPSCFLGGASWREAAASNDSTGGLLTRGSGLPLPTMPSHHALRLSPRWRPISRRGGGQRRLPAALQRSPGRGRCGSSGLFQPPLSSSPPFVLLLPPLPISGAPPVVLLKTLISGTVTTGDTSPKIHFTCVSFLLTVNCQ